MTAFDTLNNDDSRDTANFIRIALQDYVNSGETDGPDTTLLSLGEFNKDKVQKLTPDIADVNAQKRVVDVEEGDLRFTANFLTELDGRGAKRQNLDELMVNIARTYFDLDGQFNIVSDQNSSFPANTDTEGSGLEDGDAVTRYQLDDQAIVNGGGLVTVTDQGSGTFLVRLGHDSDVPNWNSAGDVDEIQLKFDNKQDALEYATFARLTFDMLSGDVQRKGNGDIQGVPDGISGNLGDEAEDLMERVIDTDRFDFTAWAFEDAGEDVRKDTAQFLKGAIEADGTSLGNVYVKVEEEVKTESLEFGPRAEASIESGDFAFTSSGMAALTGDKHASLDELLIDAAREVFGANDQFFLGSDDSSDLDDAAIVADDGTVTLATSGNPNYDLIVRLGIDGSGNEVNLTFGSGPNNDPDGSNDATSEENAEQFAAFAEVTMAILSGDIERTGSDYKAVGGYTPDITGDAAADANALVTQFLTTGDFGLFA